MGESAKTTDRPEFQRMVAYCGAVPVAAVVIYKVDRFARNAHDYAVFQAVLGRTGAELRSATEPLSDSPAGRLLQTMLAGIAQFDNDVRAERSRTGMKSVAMAGGWTQKAPVGYILDRAQNLPILLPHPVEGSIVKLLFERVGNGSLRVRDAHGWLGSQLCRDFSPATMHKILRNEVYTGVVRNKLTNGAPMPAAFPGLVPLEDFNRVQAVLLQGMHQRSEKPSSMFVARGVLRCAECGRMLLASESTGKSGQRYGYYHCKCGLRLSVERVEDAWYKHLGKVGEACQGMLVALRRVIVNYWQRIQADALVEGEKAKQNLQTIEQRIDKLVDLHVSGDIPLDVYKRKIRALELKAAVLKTEIHDALLDDNDAETVMGIAAKLVTDLPGHYERLQANYRKRFMQGVFGGPLAIDRNYALSFTSDKGIVKFVIGQQVFDISTMAPPRRIDWNTIRAFVQDVQGIADLLAA